LNHSQNAKIIFKSIFSLRTLLLLLIAATASFLTIQYNIVFTRITILFSLVFTFPLIFTLQEAFRRREQALEYLGEFRAAAEITYQCFHQSKKITGELRQEVAEILENLYETLCLFLKTRDRNPGGIHDQMQKLFLLMRTHRRTISTSVNMRVFRHLENVYGSVMKLIGISNHGTIVFLRYMSALSVFLFPLVQAPVLLGVFGKMNMHWIVYFLSIISAVTVNIMFTVQQQLENPFDGTGADDIRMQDFRLTVGESGSFKIQQEG
jgi:hypothetical protein